MNLKIICWKVRGLKDAGERLNISNLLKNWKHDVVCFQELEWSEFLLELFKVCGVVLLQVELPAFGASGGILLNVG
jgi:hypothetical protein